MKIPATIITGFLGAGKTTLIRHIIENANGRRIALLINEFGSLGIDREALLGCGIKGCGEADVVELANGCICCTVADEFLPAIEALLERDDPPQHIVIETSGLALPKPLVKAFNWPEVRSSVTVDGVIAVIDAPAVAAGRFADDPEAVQAEREADPALDHDSLLADIFEDQLRCADIVLLNKTDLVDGKDLDTVRSRLAKAIDPLIKVLPTIHGRTDTRVLLGLAAAVEDQIEARPSHHDGNGGDSDHDHDGFDSFVVALGPVGDPAALEERIRATVADHGILRVKGFVDVPGKEMRHVVQGVGPRLQRYYDRPWRPGEERRSELVVIGMAGLDQMAIQAALMG